MAPKLTSGETILLLANHYGVPLETLVFSWGVGDYAMSIVTLASRVLLMSRFT